MNGTSTHQQQQQQRGGAVVQPRPQHIAVQTCKPCPRGQGPNEAQTTCGECVYDCVVHGLA